MSHRTCWILIELTLISFKSANSYTKPNIILILADDLGKNLNKILEKNKCL